MPEINDYDPSAQGESTGDDAGSSNPMYAPYLERFPETLRPIAEETFKEWDTNVQGLVQKVHSEYEPLKPWGEFVEGGWTFEDAQAAFTIYNALNADPDEFYARLGQTYGFVGEQGQTEPVVPEVVGGIPDEEFGRDPRVDELSEVVRLIGETLVSQNEAKQAAEQDAELDNYMGWLKSTHGEFNERYVLTLMNSGMDGEEAVKQYRSEIQAEVTRANQVSRNAPTVMGSGGGLPSTQVNPSSLSGKDTRALVAQLLAQANQQT